MASCHWYRWMNDDESDSVNPVVPGEIEECEVLQIFCHLLD